MSPYGENLFPSTMMCCGRVFKPSIARCMARMDALSMFIRSISSAVAMPTAHAMAVDSMIGRSNSRWRSVSCLESFSRGWLKSSGSITAAAYTGPARQPLPASSHPASTSPGVWHGGRGDDSFRLMQSVVSFYESVAEALAVCYVLAVVAEFFAQTRYVCVNGSFGACFFLPCFMDNFGTVEKLVSVSQEHCQNEVFCPCQRHRFVVYGDYGCRKVDGEGFVAHYVAHSSGCHHSASAQYRAYACHKFSC